MKISLRVSATPQWCAWRHFQQKIWDLERPVECLRHWIFKLLGRVMTTLIEDNRITNGSASLKVKMRMLEQMAEALEDEASSLYRRAAAFEEEGFLLNREIEDRQTEINRLQMKLDSLYSERDRLIERIEGIKSE